MLPLLPLALVGVGGGGALLAAKRRHHATSTKGGTAGGVDAKKVKDGQKGVDAVKAAATALKVAGEVAAGVVKATGGNKASQNTAQVATELTGAGLGLAITGGLAVRNLADQALTKAGVKDFKTRNNLAQAAGLAVATVLGPGAIGVAAKVGFEAFNAVEGAVLGKKAAAQTRSFFHNLDPTASGTAGAKAIRDVGKAINNIFKGIHL